VGTRRPPVPANMGIRTHSEAFKALMRTGWAPVPIAASAEGEAAPWRRKRREALAAAFPGELLVVPSGVLSWRNHDQAHPFRPGSDQMWLAGSPAIDAVVVIHPDGSAVLHQLPAWSRDDDGWYTAFRNEVVDGPQPDLQAVAARLGIAAAPIADLEALRGRRARVLRRLDADVEALLDTDPDADAELGRWLSEARLIKDPWEVAQLQAAVDATVRGFEDVVAELGGQPDRGLPPSERYVETTFHRRARMDGAGVGYLSICAAGPHACTLHHIDNDGPLEDGQLLLLDMGVETEERYTADITRTLPVSGRFTPRQRAVYEVVLAAQDAALAACRPGVPFTAPHEAATAVLCDGLADLGITASADEARAEGRHVRWTLHRTSHMLGLDVHDCHQARIQSYGEGELRAGMVITVEPGLYLRHDDLLVPEDLRGTGVRLEDDVVITEDGCRVLSEALPRHPDAVEDWMAALRAT
jgi:Xaa-Pro aminopeptidase